MEKKKTHRRGAEDAEEGAEKEIFVFAAEGAAKTNALACGAYPVLHPWVMFL